MFNNLNFREQGWFLLNYKHASDDEKEKMKKYDIRKTCYQIIKMKENIRKEIKEKRVGTKSLGRQVHRGRSF